MTDKKKPRPKPKLSTCTQSRMRRANLKLLANAQRVTALKIKQDCNLDTICLDTVQPALHGFNMTYEEVQKSIVVTIAHNDPRLKFSRDWITNPPDQEKLF